MKNQHPEISVLMPACNEESFIAQSITRTATSLDKLEIPWELIIVDDGSDDNTWELATRAARAVGPHVRLIRFARNQGKGWALKTAFRASRADLVAFLDSDLEISAAHIGPFVKMLDNPEIDVVIGSKLHPDSDVDFPFMRRLMSRVYFLITRILFRLPVRDTQTGIKIFRRKALSDAFDRILVKRFAFDLELLVNIHILKYNIAQAPVRVVFRKKNSRLNLLTAYNIFVDTLGIWYRLNVLKYYQRPMLSRDHFPSVSIVIPTSPGNPGLAECIEKCLALDYHDYEIIVVSDDPVPVPEGVKLLLSSKPRPADKRDLAVKNARGEIIAFIDDDAWPDRDWLKNAAGHFGDPMIAAIGGPAVTPPDDSFMQAMSGSILSSLVGGGTTAYRYIPRNPREVDDYPTCNLLVRRQSLQAVGGFDTSYWPGEDTVLCLKITGELGKRILYVPDVLVFHHRRSLYIPYLRQVASYGLHRGFFVKKFPSTSFRLAYFLPSFLLLGALLGWIPGLWFPAAGTLWTAIYTLYLTLVMASRIILLNPLRIFHFTCGVILTHAVYGAAFILGLARKSLLAKKDNT